MDAQAPIINRKKLEFYLIEMFGGKCYKEGAEMQSEYANAILNKLYYYLAATLSL